MVARLSDTGIDCMVVIEWYSYSDKNDANDFPFVMAIHTDQYMCFATISFIIHFIKLVQGRYKEFLLAQQSWTCLFTCCCCFWLQNSLFSTGFTKLKITPRQVCCLIVGYCHLERNALLLHLSCYEKSLNVIHKNSQSYCM